MNEYTVTLSDGSTRTVHAIDPTAARRLTERMMRQNVITTQDIATIISNPDYVNPLDAAKDALTADGLPAYLYHSGGGIWLVRIDVGPGIAGIEDDDDGYMVGVYWQYGDTGEWPSENDNPTCCFADLDGLAKLVREGLALVAGPRP